MTPRPPPSVYVTGEAMTQPDQPVLKWSCPNCGCEASAEFCASCGQGRQEWNVSTLRWVQRTVGDLFEIDGKFLHTVRELVLHPGSLTQAWLEGRIASFVRPLRLYLLSSALLFGAFALPALSTPLRDAVHGGIQGWIDASPQESESSAALAATANDEQALQRIADRITVNLPRVMFILLPFAALLLKLVVRKPRYNYAVHLVWTLHVHAAVFAVITALLLLNPLHGTAKFIIAYPLAVAGVAYALAYILRAFSRTYGRSLIRSTASVAILSALYIPVLASAVILVSIVAIA